MGAGVHRRVSIPQEEARAAVAGYWLFPKRSTDSNEVMKALTISTSTNEWLPIIPKGGLFIAPVVGDFYCAE